MAPAVLLIEQGETGIGGSYTSLIQLCRLFKSEYHFHILYCSSSPLLTSLQSEPNVTLHFYKSFLYSQHHSVTKQLYNSLSSISLRVFPATIVLFELLFQLRTFIHVYMLCKANHIQIIHLNNQPKRNFIGFWVAKFLRLPVVSHIRSLTSYGFTQHHARFADKNTNHFVAVSDAVMRHWRSLALPRQQLQRIYNPIFHCPASSLDSSLESMDASNKIKMVYLGRLMTGKGVSFLLQAYANIGELRQQSSLSILGDGNKRAEYEKKAAALGLSSEVSFLGYCPDARSSLQNYDVLVQPSAHEGFGRSVLEAMDAGVAVIATKVGGLTELIEHEVTGLLVDYGNVQQLTNAMVNLICGHDRRVTFTTAAKRLVQEKFSEQKFKSELACVYRECLASSTC